MFFKKEKSLRHMLLLSNKKIIQSLIFSPEISLIAPPSVFFCLLPIVVVFLHRIAPSQFHLPDYNFHLLD
jgi:hypothetical protein